MSRAAKTAERLRQVRDDLPAHVYGVPHEGLRGAAASAVARAKMPKRDGLAWSPLYDRAAFGALLEWATGTRLEVLDEWSA